MRRAHYSERRTDPGAWAEPQRGLDMRDRSIGLARVQPEGSAAVPSACKIRVESERTIDERDHRPDILAEIGECLGGIRQSARIVSGDLEGSSGEIDPLHTVDRRSVAPTVKEQPITAERGPRESGAIVRITRDRLLQQTERLRDLARRRPDDCLSAQIKVVGGKIVCRTAGRMCSFRLLQGGLDDTGDARSDLVLKVEDIVQ